MGSTSEQIILNGEEIYQHHKTNNLVDKEDIMNKLVHTSEQNHSNSSHFYDPAKHTGRTK